MKLLYDAYICRLQQRGGINRYFEEIVSRLPADARPVLYGGAGDLLPSLQHPRARRHGVPPLAGRMQMIFRAWSSTFDIFHPTYYRLERPFEWDSIKCPLVLTVHDFTYARFGHLDDKSPQHLRDQAVAIRRADRIICVSESTRRDLHEFFPDCRAPVEVIPHGPSLACFEAVEPASRERPYFLYVGSRSFYKNFPLAVQAVAELRRRGVEADLVVAGPRFSSREEQLIKEQGCSDSVEILENPDDETLSRFYRGAVALLYPSLYEGFGLPALEAMAMGTPVLALQTSSLPEVVGSGGVLLPVEEATRENLASVLEQLLMHPAQRERLSAAARKQAANFDWNRSAEATWKVYQGVSG
jgi:glycosyltransferase involved in cell wall biosynthesis